MTEYQITSWREIPSLVVARAGEMVVKVSLPLRFQEAISELIISEFSELKLSQILGSLPTAGTE